MKKLLLVLLLAPAGLRAQASRWVTLGTPGVHPTVQVDTTTLLLTSDGLSAWFQLEGLPSDTTTTGKHYAYAKFHDIIRCAEQQLAIVDGAYYDSNGTSVDNFSSPKPQWDFFSVAPESYGEVQLRAACSIARRNHLIR